MDAMKFLSKFGGRKFALVCLVFTVSVALLTLGKLVAVDFVSCVRLILSAYIVSSIGQTILLNTVKSTDSSSAESEAKEVLGRKFILSIVVYLTTVVLLWFKYIDSASYLSITYWTVGIYVSGNVVDKLASLGLTLTTSK